MCQQRVYNFLKKHPDEWFTAKQISDKLKIKSGNVTANLQKMKKFNEVLVYKDSPRGYHFKYKLKLAKDDVKIVSL